MCFAILFDVCKVIRMATGVVTAMVNKIIIIEVGVMVVI